MGGPQSGFKIKRFKALPSLMTKAKELVVEGKASPGLVIVAEEQTADYGKGGRSYFTPKGGLYFAVILPKMKIQAIQSLNILAAFVVAEVIKEDFGFEPFIKLPNDVWVNGKKVCGVLIENVICGREVRSSVLGVDINTNIEKFPEELEGKATSLKIELGREVDNKEILKKVVKGLWEKMVALAIVEGV